MFYAKFVDGKFTTSTNAEPTEEGYEIITDDKLLGKILTKTSNGTIREQTEEEIQAEFDAFLLANKGRYIVNEAISLIKDSETLIKNDVWDNYTQPQKDSVTAYRATLKTISEQTDFSTDVVWPEKPILI